MIATGAKQFMLSRMTLDPAQLPNDIASLKAMLLAENKRANEAETRAKDLDAEIENLKLTIAKLEHATFGPSSERRSVLLDQLELQLDELVALRAQQQAAAEIAEAPAEGQQAAAPERKPRRKPARRPLPENLPRERRVQPAPTSCKKCGGDNLHKIGEVKGAEF
jgi:transposase